MENGILVLVYVYFMFEEVDFAPLLENKEKFKKFAKIIELRIMHDDFNNPLAGYTEPPGEAQMASLPEKPHAHPLFKIKAQLVSGCALKS
jgi:hypothetical protein